MNEQNRGNLLKATMPFCVHAAVDRGSGMSSLLFSTPVAGSQTMAVVLSQLTTSLPVASAAKRHTIPSWHVKYRRIFNVSCQKQATEFLWAYRNMVAVAAQGTKLVGAAMMAKGNPFLPFYRRFF